MQLAPDQVKRFYDLWKPLLLFVNEKLRVEPTMLHIGLDEPWDHQKVFAIREALWANDPLREEFIAENPAHLSPADLAIVESWRHRVAGTFCIFRHLKKYSLLIKDATREVFGVLGLASTLEELVPYTPCYAKGVLLPFEDRIIYDSLLIPYNIYLGPGIRQGLKEIYQDAKECGTIITALPLREPVGREEEQAGAQEVDARVLEAFRKYQYRSGLSPGVVERDLVAGTAFADWLAARPEPRSLRDFGTSEVRAYRNAHWPEGPKGAKERQARTGLTRLLRFLRDTGRMDYHKAADALGLLKG